MVEGVRMYALLFCRVGVRGGNTGESEVSIGVLAAPVKFERDS